MTKTIEMPAFRCRRWRIEDSYKAFKAFEGSPKPQQVAQELRAAVQAFKKNMPIIQARDVTFMPKSMRIFRFNMERIAIRGLDFHTFFMEFHGFSCVITKGSSELPEFLQL